MAFSFSPPTAPLSSAPLDPKVSALSQQLDSLDQDLARTEESIQRRLRSPLSRTDPVSDLLNRLKEQEVPHPLSSPRTVHIWSWMGSSDRSKPKTNPPDPRTPSSCLLTMNVLFSLSPHLFSCLKSGARMCSDFWM